MTFDENEVMYADKDTRMVYLRNEFTFYVCYTIKHNLGQFTLHKPQRGL